MVAGDLDLGRAVGRLDGTFLALGSFVGRKVGSVDKATVGAPEGIPLVGSLDGTALVGITDGTLVVNLEGIFDGAGVLGR